MRAPVPAAFAAAFLALPVVLLTGSPARAADVFVEANPDTVRSGDEIALRASCDDNLKPATVTAGPLGSVTVSPRYGFLTTTVRVPTGTEPGDYRITLKCSGGEGATETLHVVAKVEPARGPATGGGGTAPGRSAPLLIGGGAMAVGAGLALAVVATRRRRHG
ncbi:hypothetical protein [Actinoplanes sp. N902-109]|uniref:hypothetical protein n=1 Tax=Actinoplanes sp. (strain N902-109) TaxID=649831 RepID=UPI0003295A51|nr:hypothetical protein [Actinoplanes sp. N902-109]AGL14963.1 hypothetical protein L083_1453 [Actinoplanes sp. N902-109]